MSRTATASSVRSAQSVDEYLEHQALLAARECGHFQPGALADAMDWHPSNGSRAMSGCPHGGRWFSNYLGGLFRLATHPKTDAWPALARGQIVVKRAELRKASPQELRAGFWRHLDARTEAERAANEALVAHDMDAFAEAEGRRAAEAVACSAYAAELAARRINPLDEGRPR